MPRISYVALAVTSVALLALGSVSAATGPPALTIPAGFQHWYLVNSMIITKDSPSFSAEQLRRHPFRLKSREEIWNLKAHSEKIRGLSGLEPQ